MPLVGGYDHYLRSLRRVAEIAREDGIPRADFVKRTAERLGIKAKSAELRIDFLRKVGFLVEDSEQVAVPNLIEAWLLDGDATPLLVRMHTEMQFIGEMLKALDKPMPTVELLTEANQQYLMGWTTKHQIDHRRGWLQSAGLTGWRSDRGLYRTDAGTEFLSRIVVEPPFNRPHVHSAIGVVGVESLGPIQHDTAEHQPRRVAQVSWKDRASGVLPMPGGYDGYLDSLRWLAKSVQEASQTRSEIAERMAQRFNLTDTSVETRVSFLQKAGFLRIESGSVVLPDFMKSWLRDGDSDHVIMQLHIGVRFVGEMLEMLAEPTTTVDLHRLARKQYSLDWETRTQIENRRGWLQSAGLIRYDRRSRCLYRTDKGTDFLELVVVEPPLDGADDRHHVAVPVSPTPGREEPQRADPLPNSKSAGQSGQVDDLVNRIISASTDSKNPTEFERAVCDAFGFLGFDSEHLGGSGLTDVLLTARLGRDASYRVAVDAKTSGSGPLTDGQVDWITLGEHRRNHAADFSMVIGPNPSGRRLITRAEEQAVAVLSAEELTALCTSHAAQPLPLADYKSLFESGGKADLSAVEHRSNEANRLVALAKRLLYAIGDEAEHLGPRTARDLLGRLYRDEGAPAATEPQVRDLLASLASPLVDAIQGNPDSGYVLSCSPAVTAERLRILGEALTDI